jgi:hypothetical protein
VPLLAERVEDRLAQMDASMVERHSHFHARDRT